MEIDLRIIEMHFVKTKHQFVISNCVFDISNYVFDIEIHELLALALVHTYVTPGLPYISDSMIDTKISLEL